MAPPKKTICQQLRDVRGLAREIGHHEMIGMLTLAIEMAKKMDERLRFYKKNYDRYWWRLDQSPSSWKCFDELDVEEDDGETNGVQN